jgi:hypothetical protein
LEFTRNKSNEHANPEEGVDKTLRVENHCYFWNDEKEDQIGRAVNWGGSCQRFDGEEALLPASGEAGKRAVQP